MGEVDEKEESVRIWPAASVRSIYPWSVNIFAYALKSNSLSANGETLFTHRILKRELTKNKPKRITKKRKYFMQKTFCVS